MLLQFNFENYRSFRDEASLDLSAAEVDELSFHIISCDAEKVLPVAAIFGANASGKSNLMGAFAYMRNFVLHSLLYSNMDATGETPLFRTPFYFDAYSKQRASSFEVFVLIGERQYKYGFTVLHNIITNEWLYGTKEQDRDTLHVIFERDEKGLTVSGLLSEQAKMLTLGFSPRSLLLSLGAQINIEICRNIWQWFSRCMVMDAASPQADSACVQFLSRQFATTEMVRDNLVSYLGVFDDSIKQFRVQKDNTKESEEPLFTLSTVHENNGVTTQIPFAWESSGTKKMFFLYQPLQQVLTAGGVLWVDELNARLHPLLVRLIVCTFLNKEVNTKHAQLIFTSHEPWLLEGNLLRRDEIWFTEKLKDESCSLYSLADFKADGADSGALGNMAEDYLLGKYGAIPTLSQLPIVGGVTRDERQ